MVELFSDRRCVAPTPSPTFCSLFATRTTPSGLRTTLSP
jgi:hypothetical protein